MHHCFILRTAGCSLSQIFTFYYYDVYNCHLQFTFKGLDIKSRSPQEVKKILSKNYVMQFESELQHFMFLLPLLCMP